MRILHLTGGNLLGGAARGAYWLHKGLLSIDVDSAFVIQRNTEFHHGVTSLESNNILKMRSFVYRQLNKFPILRYKNKKNLFTIAQSGFDVRDLPGYQSADIIHLHWISAGTLKLGSLTKTDKPIVWTFRDMWPFTGGCHYTMGCDRFKENCGACPTLNSQYEFDLSRKVFSAKRNIYSTNIHPIALTNWLRDQAQLSPLCKDMDISVIPNAVDNERFAPLRQSEARRQLQLPVDRKIVLVGATSVEGFYKGFDKILEILPEFQSMGWLLLLFGTVSDQLKAKLVCEHHSLGFIDDDAVLQQAYAAADVFVAPSIQEAFGKTLIESMACGTPVVAFDATGPKDIVTHQATGWLAQPYEAQDLARGIEWLLEDSERLKAIGRTAREFAVERFSYPVVAAQYTALYERVLAQH